ncbi:toxin-activating lysine-acyltransferase [Pseudomonas phoenicis]|uniref:toxin-activating lysine-acyltransferase n=1 Tax=unclassified Pseudomonas TaxID=196821 RepID=UPI0039A01A65
MNRYYNLLTSCRDDRLNDKATMLGHAALVMAGCRRSSSFQIRTLCYWLAPAIEHSQFIMLFDSSSSPRGFLTWAHLAPDTEERFVQDPNFLLHPSEWNEGGRAWVIDFCFPGGAVKEALVMLRKLLRESGVSEISWARRRADYSIRRIGSCRI